MSKLGEMIDTVFNTFFTDCIFAHASRTAIFKQQNKLQVFLNTPTTGYELQKWILTIFYELLVTGGYETVKVKKSSLFAVVTLWTKIYQYKQNA